MLARSPKSSGSAGSAASPSSAGAATIATAAASARRAAIATSPATTNIAAAIATLPAMPLAPRNPGVAVLVATRWPVAVRNAAAAITPVVARSNRRRDATDTSRRAPAIASPSAAIAPSVASGAGPSRWRRNAFHATPIRRSDIQPSRRTSSAARAITAMAPQPAATTIG